MKFSLSILILCLAPALSQAKEFNLAIGETVSLPLQSMEPIRFQKKGILAFKDLGTELILTGKKLGETKLTIGRMEHRLRVVARDRYDTLKQIENWVKGKRGPQTRIRNGDVYITNRILSLADFIDLANFTNTHSQFLIEADWSEPLQKKVTTWVHERLKSNNLSAADLSFEPLLQLRVGAQQAAQVTHYKNILNPYGIRVVVDDNQIGAEPLIQIKVYIAHVKKSFMRQWGVAWPTEVSTTVIPGEASRIDAFTLSLQALEAQGFGQILATPTLVTQSGKPAEFHSGGEFPVKTTNRFNNNVQWKPYGLFLKTTPQTNAQRNLQINISLELSSLDHSLTSEGVPAIVRSDVKTQVNLQKPSPILLSGFLRQDSGDDSSGLPWLKQIPIFKPLFATGQVFNSELELVFILVPSFYEP